MCTLSGTAQENPHQLHAGAGVASERDFAVSGIWKKQLVGGGSTAVSSSGVYHIGYRYAGIDRHSFGIQLMAERQKVTRTGAPHPELFDKYAEWEDRYLTMVFDYQYHWGFRPRVTWYSGIAPGISWQERKEKHNDFSSEKAVVGRTRFAYQVTAIGFGFGKKLGGYAALGYGYKGVLTAGIIYGF